MHIHSRALYCIFALGVFFVLPAFAQEPDAEGGKDHPLFNRMRGYRIQRYEEKEFDSHSFRDAKLDEMIVEGEKQTRGTCQAIDRLTDRRGCCLFSHLHKGAVYETSTGSMLPRNGLSSS